MRGRDRIAAQLSDLRSEGTIKKLKYVASSLGTYADIEGLGNTYILCSNNYLGLANHPKLVEAGKQALDHYGAGASSVRFICGTFDIHRKLEESTARLLGFESSISYSSCYAANTGAIPVLLQNGDAVISDALNHASIIDGCRLAPKGVQRHLYAHADMGELEDKLRGTRGCGNVLVITDGVFSMEGDVAPLPQIVRLCQEYGAMLMVDESHATGVIGATGRGTMEHFGISEGVDIVSGTYGKALGGAGGGFIAASQDICELLIQKSRTHIFSNSMPPVLCAIAIAAIEELETEPRRVISLQAKSAYARNKLIGAGITLLAGDSAIIPIIVGDTAKAIRISEEMLKSGVYAVGFGFPVVPEGEARIRIQISDALSYEDLDEALSVVTRILEFSWKQ